PSMPTARALQTIHSSSYIIIGKKEDSSGKSWLVEKLFYIDNNGSPEELVIEDKNQFLIDIKQIMSKDPLKNSKRLTQLEIDDLITKNTGHKPSEKGSRLKGPEIGSTDHSKTLYPSVFSMDEKILYLDTPGFGENRSIEKRICASVATEF